MRRGTFSVLCSLLLLMLAGQLFGPGLTVRATPDSEEPLVMAGAPSIHSTPLVDRPLVARAQLFVAGEARLRVSGTIRKLPQDLQGEWVVGTVSVLVDADTRIEPEDYVPQLGDWASVWATGRLDQTLLATHISVTARHKISLLWVEFKGLIENIADDRLIVSGVTVHMDEYTQVLGTPLPRFIAQVRGYSQSDGSIRATVVSIIDPLEINVQFEGLIQDHPPSPFHNGTWHIGRLSVITDEHTEVSGPAPHVGLSAEVNGVLLDDERVYAREIRVVAPSVRPIEGIVRTIRETEWIIGDTVVRIDESTFVDESRASAGVGTWAEASVRITEEGDLLAIRIRVTRPH